MAKKQALGKGLSSLINTNNNIGRKSSYIENFSIDKIKPNPYQPRMNIKPEDLIDIAESIREHGVIQPLIITKDENDPDTYYIIAGERRFRAAQIAGLKTIPVVIKETSPQEMLELALIENIQRKDLNPLEEALAFRQLQNEFGLTHKLIAQKVGLSRVAITNKIRLLTLPKEIKEMILNGDISEGHARALLGLHDSTSIIAAADIIVKKGLTVRETEKLVQKINYGKKGPKTIMQRLTKQDEEWAKALSKKLGFTTQIKKQSNGGKIVIRFNNEDELKKIIDKLL